MSLAEEPVSQSAIGITYLGQLLTDFGALPWLPEHHGWQNLQSLVARSDALNWNELFEFELGIINILPLDMLKLRADALRDTFTQIATPLPLAEFAGDAYEDQLRAWVHHYQWERQWVFRTNMLADHEARRLRKRLNSQLLILMVTSALTAFIGILLGSEMLPVAVWVFSLGMLGGYSSIARRARSRMSGATRPGNHEPASALGNLASIWSSQDTVVQSIWLAGVFALIAWWLLSGNLVGQILHDSLLPDLRKTSNWWDFGLPRDGVGFSRLSIWAFIAGFAERLIPDVLDRLVSTTHSSRKDAKS